MLRRGLRRDPRLTLGGFSALVATLALAAGLSRGQPSTLDMATTPRPPAGVSTGASPLPPGAAGGPGASTTSPASGATAAPGELAATRSTPGHTSTAATSPGGDAWIEATPPPPASSPPPPTQPPGRCNVSMGGSCVFAAPTP